MTLTVFRYDLDGLQCDRAVFISGQPCRHIHRLNGGSRKYEVAHNMITVGIRALKHWARKGPLALPEHWAAGMGLVRAIDPGIGP